MSVGSWDPGAGAPITIDQGSLQAFIAHARDERLLHLAESLSSDQLSQLPQLMQQDVEVWTSACAELADDDLLHLIRFFTVAETLPGCEAAEKSPVIPIAKLLRKRGQRIDKDLLQWIRASNPNRFLPYGPL